ncbi:protein PIMREG [Ochotona princeps]|uniref:protein PIMREG n=1 Tax=Ochotona princeps TaxID=9978 RepID=UPI002715075F|nr:protein PIMREG [Ochotona princeps]
MACRWQGVGASLRHRRSLLQEEQLEEEKRAVPPVHQDGATGTLGSLCRQLQRRLPLRAVSLNLGVGPSWKRLETPEPEAQGLQAAARSAKNALGAVSQRIQESCQSGTKWLVDTQVQARRRKRGVYKKSSGSPSHSLSQKNTRPSAATHLTLGLREWEHRRLSAHTGPRTHLLRRARRDAAFWRSPYSSTEPLCSPRQSDSDLEPVGAGIQHLQTLPQRLDEAIIAEDSVDMTVSLLRD